MADKLNFKLMKITSNTLIIFIFLFSTLGCGDAKIETPIVLKEKAAAVSTKSLCFSGTAVGSNINPANVLLNPMNNLTFSFWIRKKNDILNNTGIILGFNDESADFFKIAWLDGTAKLRFTYSNSAQIDSLDVSLFQPTNWHQIAVSYNKFSVSEAMIIYIDGQKVASKNFSIDAFINTGINLAFSPSIGKLNNTCIDEAIIWNHTLSDAEILEVYKTVSPDIANARVRDYTAWWSFGEAGTYSVLDRRGLSPMTFTLGTKISSVAAPINPSTNQLPELSDVLDGGNLNDSGQGESSGPGFAEGGNGGYAGDFGDGTGSPDGTLLNP